jgi:2-octaprenyl-6-methoxyphenol hydroxylase
MKAQGRAAGSEHDIVIAGGGMVGLSLALQLGATLPPATRICLVEAHALPDPGGATQAPYHPSFDARSTALSYSSRAVYEGVGFWPLLQQWLCPIETIHVSMRGRFGSTRMAAADYGWPALGYVVENAWLGRALLGAVRQQGRVELLSPDRVVAMRSRRNRVELQLDAGDARLTTSLLVVADGADSALRQQLGMTVAHKAYRQHALIANIATDQPHRGCAFERFTAAGPVAMLPLLPAPGGERRMALVWTLPAERAEQLRSCPEDEFLARLQRQFGYRLGRLQQAGQRFSYPLQLMQTREQVRQGVVVMGNAAHALHPVAGQGFNLALRDIAGLARVLAAALAAGESPGSLTVLARYQAAQAADQQRTIAFSDKLPALFMREDPVFGLARDLALAGLDILPPLKRQFVRFAAGVGDLAGEQLG